MGWVQIGYRLGRFGDMVFPLEKRFCLLCGVGLVHKVHMFWDREERRCNCKERCAQFCKKIYIFYFLSPSGSGGVVIGDHVDFVVLAWRLGDVEGRVFCLPPVHVAVEIIADNIGCFIVIVV